MTPTEEALLTELRALRRQVQASNVRRHAWLGHFIHDLEYNPQTQFKVHLYAAEFWIINAVLVTIAQFVFQDQWAVIAVFYVAMVSLYANFATDYGAMSAAEAAMGQPPLPEIPMDTQAPVVSAER